MAAFAYTGTAEDFTVWLYPAHRMINRTYPKSGKTASYLSEQYYIKYQSGKVSNKVAFPKHEDFIRDFLEMLGYPVSSLRWRAMPTEPYLTAPWNEYPNGKRGIYFIAAEGTNLIKIGYAKDVYSRLGTIGAGCPYPMRVLTVIPGAIEDEHRLHLRFKEYNFHHEWFRLEGELLAFVDELLARC